MINIYLPGQFGQMLLLLRYRFVVSSTYEYKHFHMLIINYINIYMLLYMPNSFKGNLIVYQSMVYLNQNKMGTLFSIIILFLFLMILSFPLFFFLFTWWLWVYLPKCFVVTCQFVLALVDFRAKLHRHIHCSHNIRHEQTPCHGTNNSKVLL